MKKEVPLALGLIVGFFALLEFYLPWYEIGAVQEHLLDYAQILAAAAFVLGGVNVLQVNYPKIRRREDDWQFKIVLLVGAVVMGLAGVRWHTFGGETAPGTVVVSAAPSGESMIRIDAKGGGTFAKLGSGLTITVPEGGIDVPVSPGKVMIKLYRPEAGYTELAQEVDIGPGQMAVVVPNLTIKWGPEGRVYTWLYDHVFAPCNATMFALLAFFIASAAFRAFRARNTEAALLLGAAIIIMLGRAPIGRAMSDMLPEISDWILDVPNNAGRRAIMMGAALGAIATSLRVILGLERSHLGAD